ncbi:MAG: DUF3570 domain-containing protein [Chitinophagaceae bacterium]|nr:MAG: DUF3570 domain-containing protein [Chitinophagaceae bacterium]
MRRIFMSAALLFSIITTRSQTATDTSGFRSRKLKIEEINLVSSYYHQDGNNAAVTGGIGTQRLSDIANVIDVRLIKYDKKLRKHSLTAEVGIDHYSSASSDKIDLSANSSASHADTRIYPSLSWTRENEVKGTSIGAGLSLSSEYDYTSFGFNVNASKKSKDRNGEFTARLQVYLDQVKMILPVELRSNAENSGTEARNTVALSLGYSQIINQRLQVSVEGDLVQQQGFLSLPFYRVYFSDKTVHQEKLPDSRLKIPLGFRANYFAGDKLIIRAYYRYYSDNWGIQSNTASLELPYKITPFFSISPFYRFYNQSAAKYFSGYEQHDGSDDLYTSNYDLSKFNSQFLGADFRFAPPDGVFGWQHLSMLELRYGHYNRSNSLSSNIVSLHLKFK